jgi:DNA-directed RNA polymerase specialized sigma24 family protein
MGPCTSQSELVNLAKSGDRVALGRLLLLQYDRLLQHLSPRLPADLRRHTDVEDLLQQTFAQAHRDIGRFENRGDGSFDAWLTTIAEHRLGRLRSACAGGD